MSVLWRAAAAALVLAFSAIAHAAGAPPVPWLVIDPAKGYDLAQYGFRDRASGQMTISAVWADARPFQNGLAVVGKLHFDGHQPDGIRYGVIDEHGKTVLAPDYDGIELVTQGPLTLAFLRTEYNAWWRFWEWNWHFSLLGTSQPITQVWRDHWRVLTLPGKKELLSERMGYLESLRSNRGYHHRFTDSGLSGPETDGGIPFPLNVTASPDLFSIGKRLFKRGTGGAVRLLSDGFVAFGQHGAALVKQGDADVLVDATGAHTAQTFTPTTEVTLHDAHGAPLPLALHGVGGEQYWRAQFSPSLTNPSRDFGGETLLTPDFRPRFPFIRQEPFYRDERGRYYLASEFHIPLPAAIHDYAEPNGAFTAARIIGSAALIAALPNSAGFLISTRNDFPQPGRVFFLKPDGTWSPDGARGPTRIFPDGRIVFVGNGSRGVLNPDGSFSPTPLVTTVPFSGDTTWYLGQDAATLKYGVYAAGQGWKVPARYDYLQDELVPGIGVYRTDTYDDRRGRTSRFGLIDITANRVVTPPAYDFVDTDGRVGQHREIVNSYGVKLDPGFAFYLDPHTGEPFVTKLTAGDAPQPANAQATETPP